MRLTIKRMLCLLGWHRWGDPWEYTMEPYVTGDSQVQIMVGGRKFRFHECKCCHRLLTRNTLTDFGNGETL